MNFFDRQVAACGYINLYLPVERFIFMLFRPYREAYARESAA